MAACGSARLVSKQLNPSIPVIGIAVAVSCFGVLLSASLLLCVQCCHCLMAQPLFILVAFALFDVLFVVSDVMNRQLTNVFKQIYFPKTKCS